MTTTQDDFCVNRLSAFVSRGFIPRPSHRPAAANPPRVYSSHGYLVRVRADPPFIRDFPMSVSLFIANCETTHCRPTQQPSVRAFGSASFVRSEEKSKLNTTEFSSRFGIKRLGKIEKGFSPGAYGERLSLGRNFHFDKPQRGSRPTKNGLAIRWIVFFLFLLLLWL